MATIYFSVFHSVLVPYFRMKAGASEVKTEEPSAWAQHTVVLLRKPSFHQISLWNWCNLVKWLTISNSSPLCCCFPMTTNSVADSPVGSNHLHRLTLVWNRQGREGVGETGDVLGVSTFYFLPNKSFWVSQQVCLCLGTMFLFIPYTVGRQKKENKSFDKGVHALLLCFTLEVLAFIYIFFKKVTSNHSLCPQSSLCFHCLSADLPKNVEC